jgi:hypothetical protein
MPVTLDINKAWKHQQHGDLTVILTWVNESRALVLAPTLRRDAGWFIVDESAAFLWGVDHPDRSARLAAMQHTMRQSMMACSVLGIEPSRPNRARIISIITGWIPDLVAMPSAPLPELSSVSQGEVILKVDGQVMREEEIKVEADAGVAYG